MDRKSLQLLRILAGEAGGFVTARDIADGIGCSTRTVLRYIQQLRHQENAGGFSIVAHKGQGYRLNVDDRFLLDSFLEQPLHSKPTEGGGDVLRKAALLLLLHDGLRMEDLAQQLNYSLSSVARLSSQLGALLFPYSLQLEGKAGRGMQLRGSEAAIRAATVHFLPADGLPENGAADCFAHSAWKPVRQEVAALLLQKGLNPSSAALKQFMRFLTVCVARCGQGRFIDFSGARFPEEGLVSVQAQQAVLQMQKAGLPFLAGALPPAELLYMALVFEQSFYSMELLKNRYQKHPAFFHRIVDTALRKIKENYNADFSRDKVLYESLSQHIATSYGCYLLGMEGENPYSEAVQSRYPVAHYYSIELAAQITVCTGMSLPVAELAFLTLHMASSLERGARSSQTPVAILCSTAFGTASLLKSRITRQYDNVDVVGVYSLEEVGTLHLPVELYISTVPLEMTKMNGKPLIVLSPFLDGEDARRLDKALTSVGGNILLEDFFCREHFFRFEKPMKKDDVLHTMCDALIAQGSITPADKVAIFLRESLVSTEIAPGVAMPHCIIRGSSFLAFALLKSPAHWGKHKSGLVMLGCFQEGDERVKQLLMQIYRVLGNTEQARMLTGCDSFDGFHAILNSFFEGDTADAEKNINA